MICTLMGGLFIFYFGLEPANGDDMGLRPGEKSSVRGWSCLVESFALSNAFSGEGGGAWNLG